MFLVFCLFINYFASFIFLLFCHLIDQFVIIELFASPFLLFDGMFVYTMFLFVIHYMFLSTKIHHY